MIVVTVARKPLQGSIASKVLAHGTGGINIDACRVTADGRPLRVIDPKPDVNGAVYAGRQHRGGGFDDGSRAVGATSLGRWPANLILQHDARCQKIGARRVRGITGSGLCTGGGVFTAETSGLRRHHSPGGGQAPTVGADGTETVEEWDCAGGCPVRELDDQSGMSQSQPRSALGAGEPLDPSQEGWRFRRQPGGFIDTGGASRFFKQVKGE